MVNEVGPQQAGRPLELRSKPSFLKMILYAESSLTDAQVDWPTNPCSSATSFHLPAIPPAAASDCTSVSALLHPNTAANRMAIDNNLFTSDLVFVIKANFAFEYRYDFHANSWNFGSEFKKI